MWFSCLFILLHQEIQVTFTSTFAEKNIRKHEDCDNIIEGVTIHWELNGLSQDDPKLIEKIKTKVLWKPSTNSDVFGEQKSGSGLGFPFRVRFRDQHFGDVRLGVSGFFR